VDASANRSRARRTTRLTITAADRELLGFLAEHRLVLDSHLKSLLGSRYGSGARLRTLERAGLLRQGPRFGGQPRCFQITRPGLDVVGSRLPAPRIDLREYKHDVGVAWLWLAAGRGAFGPVQEMISERALRSRDMASDGDEPSLGVRLGLAGPEGRERLHYPDLLLVDPRGCRIAIELELTSKGVARRDRILAGYASDARIDAVLYLVEKVGIGRKVEASARAVGATARVQIHRVEVTGFSTDGARAIGGVQRRRARPTELTR
jgi:hypothetical protein